MNRILQVTALPDTRLHVCFTDGVQGEVDLSHLSGRGVFAAWDDINFFRQVTIGKEGELCWGDQIDLCPDTIYMQLTGKTPEEIFPNLQGQADAHA